ncbi:MAG TPA: SpoIID/LytB domain-containing protein [Mycobacteriales bacterium]
MRRSIALVVSVSLVAGAAAAVTVLGPSLPAGAAEDYPAPADGVFRLTGHGFGHGIGLSQYGARNAATLGRSGTQILDFYYPRTTTVTEPASMQVRVRLTAASATAVPVQGAAGLAVRDAASGRVTALRTTAARYRIVADATALRVQASTNGGASWSAVTSGAGPLVFQGAPELRLYLPDGTSRGYQGTIAGVRSGDTTLLTVNTLGLDPYVAGVLPREMPPSWPAAALRAQAVAARTFAAFERAGRPASASYDVCDTTQCQVYGGRRLYSGGTVTDLQPASVRLAVAQTARQVRTFAGGPILAQFGASNGGWTVGDPRFAYLPAKADPYDPIDNPYATWTASLSVARLGQCFPAAGTVQRITVLRRDGHGQWGGRMLSVRLTGRTAAGTVTQDVTGASLRSCAGMRTAYATVTSGLRVTVTPAGIRNPDGSIDLFARGPGGDLQHRRYLPGAGWQAWQSHGGQITGAPTVSRDADGSLVVWARGGANRLYGGVWRAGAWRGWTPYGGSISSRPSPAVLPDGSRYVVARGTDGRLQYASWTAAGAFTGWHNLGGALYPAGPSVAATGTGGLVVAVVGGHGQVYVRSMANGVWAPAFTPIGGITSSDVAVAVPAAGVVDVYVRGLTGARPLFTARAVDRAWGGWHNAGGGLAAGPWVDVVEGGGRTEIWAAGADAAIYLRKRAATWTPWERQPA